MTVGRPTIVYDDDCGFCTWSVEYAMANGEFAVVGFSELTDEQRHRLPEGHERCSHLLTEEEVYSCGGAAEATLIRLSGPAGIAGRTFGLLPVSVRRAVREPLYRVATDNRDKLGSLVRRDPPSRGGRRPGEV
jgi:predicted DCC family thiol-disulfide oxidoreductase YuxK